MISRKTAAVVLELAHESAARHYAPGAQHSVDLLLVLHGYLNKCILHDYTCMYNEHI